MPDSPAVKIWRDKWRKNLNAGWRHDIDLTIQDLALWKMVLDGWGYWNRGKWVSHNPMSVSKQLSEYERLERKRESSSSLAYTERLL